MQESKTTPSKGPEELPAQAKPVSDYIFWFWAALMIVAGIAMAAKFLFG
jgi:hypothetical protein